MLQCASFGSSTPDEAKDASTPDRDAAIVSPDGAALVDARPTTTSPCVGSSALVCDDFEREDVRGLWGRVEQDDGGLTLNATPDAGRALLFTGPPDIRSVGYLERFIDANPEKVTLSYRLRVDSLPATTNYERFVFLQQLYIGQMNGAHGRVFVTLNEIAGELRLQYGDRNPGSPIGYDFTEESIGDKFPLGKWETVSITIDANAKTVTATSSFSTGTLSLPLPPAAREHMVRGPLTARVGASHANPVPGGWRVEIDDYVLAP